ncbi:MAG: shikimate kinase [Acidimicrobiia bacterium]
MQGHLVLVGLMGAGKTTVGKRCAELLGRPFVDTDELVVAAAGVPFEELWATEGEAGFRARERVAVADAAASPAALVIAGGGGVVLDPDNRRVLRGSGFVVWLDAPPAVLASRLGGDDSRPLLVGGDRVTTLTRLGDTRAPAYEAAADVTVDTEGRTVDEVAASVLEELHAWNA